MARPSRTRIDKALFEEIAAVLRVLGNPSRLRIVDVLLRQEVSVAELAKALHLAPNTVSQHLNHMLAHGIVRKERRGHRVYYRVASQVAGKLLACIRERASGRASGW